MAGRWRAPTHSWATLRDNVNREVDRLNGVYIRLLEGAGVKLHMGRGRLMDRHTIEVGERDRHGRQDPGRHRRPARDAADSRAASSPSPPTRRSICPTRCPSGSPIVGGGYIAVEFAGIFHGLGCEVDIVIRRDRVLRGFDEECRTFVHEALKASGIKMRTETRDRAHRCQTRTARRPSSCTRRSAACSRPTS